MRHQLGRLLGSPLPDPVEALPAVESGTWQITDSGQNDDEPVIVCSLTGGPQFRLRRVGSPPEAEFTYLQGQFTEPAIYFFMRHS